MRLLAKIEDKKSPKAENHDLKLRRAEEELGERNHGRLVALRRSTHSRSQFLTRGLPTRTCSSAVSPILSLFLASRGLEGGPLFPCQTNQGCGGESCSIRCAKLTPQTVRQSKKPTSTYVNHFSHKEVLFVCFSHLQGRGCSFLLVFMLIFNS